MLVDFSRLHSTPLTPVNIQRKDIERVDSYKYPGVHLNNKLDWTHHADALYRRGQNHLFLQRRQRSFGMRGSLLRIFYLSVVASTILYGVVCGAAASQKERQKSRTRSSASWEGGGQGCPL